MFDLSFLDLLGPEYEWFPRRCMTSASKGQILVSSKEQLLAEIEKANYTDCFLATHKPEDKERGIIRVVFIDLDFPNDLSRANKVFERVYSFIVKEFGIHPHGQFSGSKGYHLLVPIGPVEVGNHASAFLKHMQIRLSKGYCDRAVLGDLVRLFRIPDTINSKSGRLCYVVKEWDGGYLDSGLLWEEFKFQKFQEELKRKERPKLAPKSNGIRPEVQILINRLKEGQNLAHFQRLAIVNELIARGWADNEILGLFRSLPDFSEQKTLYYIKHARSKGYRPFATKRLRELLACQEG